MLGWGWVRRSNRVQAGGVVFEGERLPLLLVRLDGFGLVLFGVSVWVMIAH